MIECVDLDCGLKKKSKDMIKKGGNKKIEVDVDMNLCLRKIQVVVPV